MLESKIEALTKAIEALTAMLDVAPIAAKPKPKAKAAPKAEPEAEPEAAPTMDIDAVTAMALKASRNGHGDAIKAKLAEIGAPRISRLDAAGLATFAAWVEGLEQ